MEETTSISRRKLWIAIGIMLSLMVGSFWLMKGDRFEPSFKFIKVDHPVEMWASGKDRWAYYSLGTPDMPKLIADARAELIPLGYTEDHSKPPWTRFSNGSKEVVLCNHNEFELNYGNKLQRSKHTPGSSLAVSQWPCVLVKNEPFVKGSLTVFKINQLVHGW